MFDLKNQIPSYYIYNACPVTVGSWQSDYLQVHIQLTPNCGILTPEVTEYMLFSTMWLMILLPTRSWIYDQRIKHSVTDQQTCSGLTSMLTGYEKAQRLILQIKYLSYYIYNTCPVISIFLFLILSILLCLRKSRPE